MRCLLVGILVLLTCVGSLYADDVKGKVKSVDAEKRTVTLTVDDKERTYQGTASPKVVVSAKGKISDLPNGLAGLKKDDTVTLTLEKKDDQLVFTQVLLDTKKKK